MADALLPVVSELVIVSNDPSAASWLPGARAVQDARAERASLVGIHTALRAANANDALVVAWDMPFVETSLLRLLAERVRQSTYAVVPETGSGVEATCAAYRPACLPFVERLLDEGAMTLSRFVHALPEHETIRGAELTKFGNPRRLFFNVNTPQDLARAEAMLAAG